MSESARRWFLPAAVALLVLAAAGVALWRRGAGPDAPSPTAPRVPPVPPPSKETRLGVSPPPPTPPKPPEDVRIDLWIDSIKGRIPDGVRKGEMAFRQREDSFRDRLVRVARENPDPQVRAFSIAVLLRFKAPPPEAFFVACLEDSHEYSRENALKALEKFGTPASLEALERVARSDPVERLRTLAAGSARAVRER
jgi:hypothetical protein